MNEPRCKKCNDTGRYIVDEGYKGLTSYVCECQPGVSTCNDKHVSITFSRFVCPLCAAFIRIAWLEAEMKKLRGLQRSAVQIMNEHNQAKNNDLPNTT